jgi:hypothetical protein
MPYINEETKEYPITEDEVKRRLNISVSGQFLPPAPYKVVFPTPQPTYNSFTQTCKEVAPVLTKKHIWEQAWMVTQFPPETIAINAQNHRLTLLNRLSSIRQTKENVGFKYTFGTVEDMVQTTATDIRNIQSLYMRAMTMGKTEKIPFRAGSNNIYMITPNDMIMLGNATFDFISSTYAWKWEQEVIISALIDDQVFGYQLS